MTDDRSAFTEARDAGLRQRHEQRLDRARERPCLRFIHTDEDKDWTCICGHGADDHGMSPSKPSGPCQECATYTEAQVKALTKTAGDFAYALGRKEAAEEIALAIEDLSRHDYRHDEFAVGTGAAAKVARDIGKADPT